MKSRDPFELVGKTIGGKYAVESVVDEGGFSVVYRATHLLWNRPVAIKAFKTEEGLSEDARGKMLFSFLQEGALLAELSARCAAICQARDVATVTTESGDWVPYMVLEWLEGETLEAAMSGKGATATEDLPRSLASAMILLAPIADALAVVHAHGVAHCDVKPGNILLLRGGQSENAPQLPTAKLLDFGIAKVLHRATASGRGPFGISAVETLPRPFTPSYGAPEQFSTSLGPTGPWTDVFALALIVVELVIGGDALVGDDLRELARQSANVRVRPTPLTRGVDVGEAAEAVLSRALAVEPMHRFPSAGVFWKALQHAAERAPEIHLTPLPDDSAPPVVASARSPTVRAPQRRPQRTPRVRLAAIALAVLTAATATSSLALPHRGPASLAGAAPALAANAASPFARVPPGTSTPPAPPTSGDELPSALTDAGAASASPNGDDAAVSSDAEGPPPVE